MNDNSDLLPVKTLTPDQWARLSRPPTLAERMRQHPQYSSNVQLVHHVHALEALGAQTPTREILGTWARARLFWRDLTGEPVL